MSPVRTFHGSEQQSVAGHEPDFILQHSNAFEIGAHNRIAKRERLDNPTILVVEFIDDRFFIVYRQQPLVGRQCQAGNLAELLRKFPLFESILVMRFRRSHVGGFRTTCGYNDS